MTLGGGGGGGGGGVGGGGGGGLGKPKDVLCYFIYRVGQQRTDREEKREERKDCDCSF